jgi:recombination protein RecT
MGDLVTGQNQIAQLLSANMKALKSVLPKHLTPERIMRIAYIAIERVPKLAECTKASLINAILEASILGLEISTPLGQAHLIPYGRKATLIIGYLGFVDLAFRSEKISKFSWQAVYEKDHFKYQYGTNAFIEHKPSDDLEPGALKYAYAIAEFKDGSMEFEVVNERTAMATKARSAARNKADSPWNTGDEWTMWVKTAMRKLAKRLPMSPELQRASVLDEYAEAGIKQNISYVPDKDEEIITASDLTKQIQGQNGSPEPQNKEISKKTTKTTHKKEKVSPPAPSLSRSDLIAEIQSYDPNVVEGVIFNFGWSEATEVEGLSFEMAKQLLDGLKEVADEK